VLFLLSSQDLEALLHGVGLPAFPLVPVSSSQVIIGAIIGIGLLKGGRGVKYRVLAKIFLGWVATPVLACIVAYLGLFIVSNIFNLRVFSALSSGMH
jgi:PiT family inorganic phosphate transporter